MMSSILDEHTPLRTRIITLRPHAPWYNNEIREQKTICRKCERCWRRYGLAFDYQSYVDQCLVVKNTIFKSKRDYYSNLIDEAGSDNKSLFRTIDRLLHRKPEKCLPSCSSATELSNNFITFFESKIINIRCKLEAAEMPDLFCTLDKLTLDCQLNAFSPTSIVELSEVARTVVSKSCSLDPLPAVLLKENFDLLLPTLCRIVNLSLESGYVPPSIKTAVLLPLLKKPSLDHEILSNYRPISNLKVISKIIEKVVAVRLQDYLESNQLNEPLQSAYKRFHSCETALVRVHNDILRAIDDRHCVILLLLDLSAAFGHVDYDILITRLKSKFSICGTALEWFRSYLTNRTQFT